MPKNSEDPQIVSQSVSRKSKILLAAGILLLLILVLSLFFSKNSSPALVSNPSKNKNDEVLASPSPTPFEFEEMTIPFLRQRQYSSKLGEMEKVSEDSTYTSYLTSYSSDGLKINGLLTEPKGEKPANGWPAVIFLHGYIPPNQYQTIQPAYSSYVDYIARNGFAVFKIDYRGNGNSEGEPGGSYYSSDYIIDALNAYSAMQSADFVNPKAIGLWGHSMSGNVTLRTLAAKPDIPAAVIWAGAGYTYTDLLEYRITDNSYRPQPSDSGRQQKRQKMRDLYGDPKSDNWFWKIVAPTNYLTDLKGAIQLDHAVNDETVNINYSRNLNKLLDETTVPHEFYEYPSGGHNISDANFTVAMQHTVEFFKKYLK